MKMASGEYTDMRRSMLHRAQPFPKLSISERPNVRVATIDSSIDMYCNIHVPAAACGLGLAALLSVPAVLQAQGDCPSAAGAVLEAAWREYHHNAMGRALEKFEQARRLCPENSEATTGLGFTLL